MTSPPANKKASACDAGGETGNVFGRQEVNTTAGPLQAITLDESRRLIELEKVIEAGQQTFKEVGTALAEIRDSRLYKADHPTFESYCVSKWGFGKSYGYQLIESAAVANEVSAIADIKTESQARALAKVPESKRVAVITHASKDGPLTARKIRVAAGRDIKPKAASVSQRLRDLWATATESEKDAFLLWVKTDAEPVKKFRCESCEEEFESDDDAVMLYECNDCGSKFTRETSANDNHSCPDCNKFGSKVSDCGCPECNEGELEPISASKEDAR